MIDQAVARSQRPDFVRYTLAARLKVRRDYMIARLNMAADPQPRFKSYGTELTTAEQRDKAAKHYGISPIELEKALIAKGVLNFPYQDILSIDGKVASCKTSIIVNLLEKRYYPEGLGGSDVSPKKCVWRPR